MRRTLVLCGCLIALAAATAAETSDDPLDALEDPRPGLITADSPLYELDIAVDNALMAVGLRSAADVAHKRASEALVAAEANDTAAAERAIAETQRTAALAHGVNDDGLVHAEQLLLEAKEHLPAAAHDGVDTAVTEIQIAQERFPTDVPDRGVLDAITDRSPDRATGQSSGGDR